MNAVKRAIEIAGSEAKLARLIGVSQPSINAAKHKGAASARMAVAIERALNGSVTCAELCPEVFSPIQGDAQ